LAVTKRSKKKETGTLEVVFKNSGFVASIPHEGPNICSLDRNRTCI